MKIEIFPDKFKDGNINGERLIEFLKSVKSELTVSFIANQGENLLFEHTIILAKLVQKLWNELEDLKAKQEGNKNGMA